MPDLLALDLGKQDAQYGRIALDGLANAKM